MIRIRITGDRGFERIPGKLPIFREIAQNGAGDRPLHAMSPERLYRVVPLGEYMNA